MLKQILYGILGIAFGALLTIKANWFVDTFGRISWAERHFGSAGTYGFVRLLGVILSVIFFFYAIGMLGPVYLAIIKFLSTVFGTAA